MTRSLWMHSPVKRLLVATIAISLLSMPVNYTGGAEAAHPHVFVQLWMDATKGSFTHHASSDPARTLQSDSGVPLSLGVRNTPPAGQGDNGEGQGLDPLQTDSSLPKRPPAQVDVDPTGPTLTNPGLPEMRSLNGLLPAPGVQRLLEMAHRYAVDISQALTGYIFGPEPPPPRIAHLH